MSRVKRENKGIRDARAALFDGMEAGVGVGLRSGAQGFTAEMGEQENDRVIESLEDRVSVLKRLTGEIHDEVENQNRFLDRMSFDLEGTRNVLAGTMDRFTKVFRTSAGRNVFFIAASCVAGFFLVYYLTRK